MAKLRVSNVLCGVSAAEKLSMEEAPRFRWKGAPRQYNCIAVRLMALKMHTESIPQSKPSGATLGLVQSFRSSVALQMMNVLEDMVRSVKKDIILPSRSSM